MRYRIKDLLTMKKSMLVSLISGILISVVALYFAFRNVPFSELIDYTTSVNYFWMMLSILLVLASFVFRVLRWQVILSAITKIKFWRAYHPLMIGFMLNCIMPARIGELARPAILHQKDKVPFTSGLATVATERIFDLLILILLLTIVFSSIQIDTDLSISFGKYELNKKTLESIASGMVKLCLLLIFGIILVSINYSRTIIKKIIMGIPDLLFSTGSKTHNKTIEYICNPLVGIVDNIATGFGFIKSIKDISICLFFSSVIWILQAVSYYLIALGCPGIELSFFEITAVMIILCFFIALPSVPGFWGLWEAGGVFALSLFAVSSTDAAGFSLVSHVVQMFPVIIVGLISMLLYGINIKQINMNKNLR